jgi:hypothetical protein
MGGGGHDPKKVENHCASQCRRRSLFSTSSVPRSNKYLSYVLCSDDFYFIPNQSTPPVTVSKRFSCERTPVALAYVLFTYTFMRACCVIYLTTFVTTAAYVFSHCVTFSKRFLTENNLTPQ